MFKLEPFDKLAKRRAILDENDIPVAWVDYDDISQHEADWIAEKMLAGLNRESTASRHIVFKRTSEEREDYAGFGSEWKHSGVLYSGDVTPEGLGLRFGEGTFLAFPEDQMPKPVAIQKWATWATVDFPGGG